MLDSNFLPLHLGQWTDSFSYILTPGWPGFSYLRAGDGSHGTCNGLCY